MPDAFSKNPATLTTKDTLALLSALDQTAMISMTDAKGDIIFVNDKLVAVSKYSREELLGKNHRILKSGDQPEQLFVGLWKTISSGKIWRGEIKNRAKDGTYYWVDTSIAPILDSRGKPERYVSVRFLISDRKKWEQDSQQKIQELEEAKLATLNLLEDLEEEEQKTKALLKENKKFRLAVENTDVHIIITDANGVILYANKAAEHITGFSAKEILGKKAGSKQLWGGLMGPEFYTRLWHTIKEEKKPFVGEIRNRRKNGQEYYAFSSISPVLDEQGAVEFFVAIERDISDQKAVDKAKTEFVSLASHQLRTPLTAINWYAEMLLEGDVGALTSEQKKYLDEIYKGNQRMVSLVGALLNVSRLELGTFMVEPTLIDIAAVLQNAVEEQRFHLEQKKQRLTSQIQETMPLLQMDPKLLGMIFQNLLSNAVKYTPPEGNINLEMNLHPAGTTYHGKTLREDTVCFSLRDTGYGIPLEQQNQIFTKLFRADNVKEKETDGTGLGLYIVKSVVEHCRGEIWFESEQDRGSTFYVLLPSAGMQRKEGTKTIE